MPVCGAIGIAGLWLLTHPYVGIDGDARIYVGRAMADLDPAGIGRQLDFVHDGQSPFSVFPALMALAVRWLGPGAAAMTIALIGLVAWLIAAGFLASRLFRGREAWIAMAGLAVLPLTYGGYYGGHSVFNAAEALATPRIFSEAGSLAALALLLGGRRLFATGAWLAAMAVHPIIALAAGAVGFVLLVLEDRRWLWLAVAGIVAVIMALAAGAPLAVRLFQPVDPVWRALLADRSGEIFPGLWPRVSWERFVLQLTVVALGSTVLGQPFRRVGLATIVVMLGGIAVSMGTPSVLVVQAQLWRAQWLAAVLAGLAFAPCIISSLRLFSPLRLPFARPPGWARGVAVAVAAGLAIAGALLWDRRPAPVRARETPGVGRALQAVVRSGQVFWLDSPGNAWLWTGRPEWWNQIESGGGLFDRPLEMEWDRRFRVLEHAGFAASNDVSFSATTPRPAPTTLGRPALSELCRSPDGPDWVMLPVERADPAVMALARTVWRDQAAFACADFSGLMSNSNSTPVKQKATA